MMVAPGTMFLIISYHLVVHVESWHGYVFGVVGILLLLWNDSR